MSETNEKLLVLVLGRVGGKSSYIPLRLLPDLVAIKSLCRVTPMTVAGLCPLLVAQQVSQSLKSKFQTHKRTELTDKLTQVTSRDFLCVGGNEDGSLWPKRACKFLFAFHPLVRES
jgi:hypothetical protein